MSKQWEWVRTNGLGHEHNESRSLVPGKECTGMRSPIPDLVVVPELQEQTFCQEVSPGLLCTQTFLSPRSSGSSAARASSITSSIFDLSFESAQLEKALVENDTYTLQKIFEIHFAKFPRSVKEDRLSVGSRSRRPSSRYSTDTEVNRRCPTPIEFFDRRESVTPECDIPLIFKTALHVAIHNNSTEAVKLLLRCNIDPNFPNANLISHIKAGCHATDALKINILKPSAQKGSLSPQIDYHNTRADHNSINIEETSSCLAPPAPVISDDLGDYSVDDLYHLPPLFLSIVEQKPVITHLLLLHGADPTVQDSRGNTPLHLAVSTSFFNLSSVRELLQYGAKTYEKNLDGKTPCDLHHNVSVEQQTVIRALLAGFSVSRIADPNVNLVLEDSCKSSKCDANSDTFSGRLLRRFSKSAKFRPNVGSSTKEIFHEMRERLSSASSGRSARSKHQSVIAEDLDSDVSQVSNNLNQMFLLSIKIFINF